MGFEYRLCFAHSGARPVAEVVRSLPFAHENRPQSGEFELRTAAPDGRMPDAAVCVEPYGLYFRDNGGDGKALLGILITRLAGTFGAVTLAELEDDDPAPGAPPEPHPVGSPCSIVAAGNTVVPVYLALRQKGYRIRREVAAGPEEVWSAEGPDCLLKAEDPATLLGLAAMYEVRGRNWSASDAEIDEFLERFPQEDE